VKWYKHDPSAALAGMIGLTVEERGAYYTLMDLQYARAPHNDVTDDLVVKALAVRPHTWRRLKAALMAKGKVQEKDGKLSARRVKNEVSTAVQLMFKTKFNGVTSKKINDLSGTNLQPQPIENLCKGSKGKEEPDYRSPPRKKSDNVLTPFPDKRARHK
jgi:uncharacterized protein YdaU (DUF1376 family)